MHWIPEENVVTFLYASLKYCHIMTSEKLYCIMNYMFHSLSTCSKTGINAMIENEIQ
jgi:hypothetical protein